MTVILGIISVILDLAFIAMFLHPDCDTGPGYESSLYRSRSGNQTALATASVSMQSRIAFPVNRSFFLRMTDERQGFLSERKIKAAAALFGS
jgi:hypothetical protein